jgi:hypothetical protein
MSSTNLYPSVALLFIKLPPRGCIENTFILWQEIIVENLQQVPILETMAWETPLQLLVPFSSFSHCLISSLSKVVDLMA